MNFITDTFKQSYTDVITFDKGITSFKSEAISLMAHAALVLLILQLKPSIFPFLGTSQSFIEKIGLSLIMSSYHLTLISASIFASRLLLSFDDRWAEDHTNKSKWYLGRSLLYIMVHLIALGGFKCLNKSFAINPACLSWPQYGQVTVLKYLKNYTSVQFHKFLCVIFHPIVFGISLNHILTTKYSYSFENLIHQDEEQITLASDYCQANDRYSLANLFQKACEKRDIKLIKLLIQNQHFNIHTSSFVGVGFRGYIPNLFNLPSSDKKEILEEMINRSQSQVDFKKLSELVFIYFDPLFQDMNEVNRDKVVKRLTEDEKFDPSFLFSLKNSFYSPPQYIDLIRRALPYLTEKSFTILIKKYQNLDSLGALNLHSDLFVALMLSQDLNRKNKLSVLISSPHFKWDQPCMFSCHPLTYAIQCQDGEMFDICLDSFFIHLEKEPKKLLPCLDEAWKEILHNLKYFALSQEKAQKILNHPVFIRALTEEMKEKYQIK
ncbi:MAG: hypothetical protein ACOVOR_03615 [Rhabdochlamydiaceae bacterium]